MRSIQELASTFKTQKEFGEAIGVSQSMVSDLLKGNKRLSPKNCKAIEAKFGIPRADLRPDIYA